MSGWLFLHGFTGSPASFLELLEVMAPAEPLVPALLGHGPAPPLSAKSFEEEVERLALRTSAHFENPIELVGYSLGARLGLALLLAEPQRFRRALLIGPNPGLESVAEREARRAADAELCTLLEQQGLGSFLDHWQSLPLFASQDAVPTASRERQRRIRQSHRASSLSLGLGVLGLGNMPSYWSRLPEIAVPVTLLVGEHDAKFRQLGQAMSQVMPRARLKVAAGAGHNVLLEAPRYVAQLLAEGPWT